MPSAIWTVLLLGVLVSQATAEPVVSMARAQVNVRADATVRSTRLAVLREGEQVEVLGRKDEWLQVRLSTGGTGWVHSDLTRAVLVVTGDDVRIRAAGSTSARVVAIGRRGDELERLGQAGRWVNVALPGGEQGWIWSRLVAAKQLDTATQPPPGQQSPPPATARADSDTGQTEEPAPAQAPPPGRTHPFVQGLQLELEGEHARALGKYLQVAEDDPRYAKAQLHAATAEKRLGNYTQARRLLDKALARGAKPRAVYSDMADLYHLSDQPDSAAKYLALAAGQPWQPSASAPVRPGAADADAVPRPLLLYAAAAAALVVLMALALFLVGRHRAHGRGAISGRFNQTLRESRQRLQLDAGEADELDRRIAEKRKELAGATAFAAEDAGKQGEGRESAELERLVEQLDVLRRGLEMQEAREQAYADLLRLQNMKIEALEEELSLRRAHRTRG